MQKTNSWANIGDELLKKQFENKGFEFTFHVFYCPHKDGIYTSLHKGNWCMYYDDYEPPVYLEYLGEL